MKNGDLILAVFIFGLALRPDPPPRIVQIAPPECESALARIKFVDQHPNLNQALKEHYNVK